MQAFRTTAAFIGLLATFVAASTATAIDNPPRAEDPAQEDEPMLEQLRTLFKNESLALGMLIQTGARYSKPRSGFSLGTARLNIQGALDGGFNYKLQTDFVESVALKDALIGYQASPGLGFTGGRYKTPFSYEELTSTSSTPFINRSRIVRALAPGRQIGAHIIGSIGSTVDAHIGAFNGNNVNFDQNNNRLLYVGRLESTSETDAGTLVFGANGAYDDRPTRTDEAFAGADFYVEQNGVLVSGEAIYGRRANENPIGPATLHPFGHHLTVGYTVPTTETFNQLLLRWDRYTPDTDHADSNQLIFGYVGKPTGVVRIEANYVLPIEAAGVHQAMIQVQLAF
jgi:hypothetical protein